jgi:hypothetical protein
MDGFDLPVEKKENPGRGKEGFVEPEHRDLRAAKVFTRVVGEESRFL